MLEVSDLLSETDITKIDENFPFWSDKSTVIFSLHWHFSSITDEFFRKRTSIYIHSLTIFFAIDGKYNCDIFTHLRWYDESLVIRMRRYNSPYRTRRESPRSIPWMRKIPLSILVLNTESFHKTLSKKMRSTYLKSPAIRHHRLKCIGHICSCEFL